MISEQQIIAHGVVRGKGRWLLCAHLLRFIPDRDVDGRFKIVAYILFCSYSPPDDYDKVEELVFRVM
jgi:hypothetical protein